MAQGDAYSKATKRQWIKRAFVAVSVGLMVALGFTLYRNFMGMVRYAISQDPIRNCSSLSASVQGMLGTGKTPAEIVSLVDGKNEYPTEVLNGPHDISKALMAMAWSPVVDVRRKEPAYKYTVHAVVKGPGVLVCVLAQSGSIKEGVWEAETQPRYILYSSVPVDNSDLSGWEGGVYRKNFLSGAPLVAGGACKADGTATIPQYP